MLLKIIKVLKIIFLIIFAIIVVLVLVDLKNGDLDAGIGIAIAIFFSIPVLVPRQLNVGHMS